MSWKQPQIKSVNINQDEFCLVNIYAPNDQTQQVDFFAKVLEPIRRNITSKILVGGDFNCPMSAFDKVGGKDILHRKTSNPIDPGSL